MSYLDEVVKREYRHIVESNPRLRRAAQFIYMTRKFIGLGYGRLKKQFNKYLEMIWGGRG